MHKIIAHFKTYVHSFAGKSLVWVAILGLVVFYLYAIVSFALMRSMFDPESYLYCASLWECTITVIRYGLIGDLFEVSNFIMKFDHLTYL